MNQCSLGCVDGTCLDDGTCQCKEDYFGPKCNFICPTNCKSTDFCSSNNDSIYGLCSSCIPGFYTDNCTLPCLSDCLDQQCNHDSGYCDSCASGFYLNDSKICLQCSPHCSPPLPCDNETGICLNGCMPGYTGDKCFDSCPDECDGNCTSKGICYNCKKGFYITNQTDSHCAECPSTCFKSQNDELVCYELNDVVHCHQCYQGYFGIICDKICDEGCEDQICNRGGVCEECSRGYYKNPESASGCSKCPENCATSNVPVCEISNGSISCAECNFQFWGSDCSQSCSNCPNGCNKAGTCNACDNNQYHHKEENKCLECPSTCQYRVDTNMCTYNGSQLRCFSCDNSHVYGDLCDQTCDEKCKNGCDRDSGKCKECKDDIYYGDACEFNCSSFCFNGTCSQNGTCKSCQLGQHGEQCDLTCPEFCSNTAGCEQFTGHCFECDGKHSGELCQDNCTEGCAQCNQDYTCIVCEDNFYKTSNDTKCTSCSQTCEKTNNGSSCEKTSGMCYKCIDNHAGKYCEIRCPDNCSGGCQVEGDKVKCNACIEGFYKDNCEEKCQEGCDKGCHQDSGLCKDCIVGYYSKDGDCLPCPSNCQSNDCSGSGTCFACKIGYFGERCDETCGINCLEGLGCNQTTGNCIKCGETYWGPNCEKCDENCVNHMCDDISGKCKECKNTSYGFWCDKNCSSNCLNSVCDQEGKCKSCIEGKYGYNCSMDCGENCESSCDQEFGKCKTCKFNYFGEECLPCPENCRKSNNSCDRFIGTCNLCEDGFWGEKCELNCSKSFCENSCDQSSGICDSCKLGYFKHQNKSCIKCSEHCLQNEETGICDEKTGKCYGCEKGFYGDNCEKSCDQSCKETCDQQSGNCTECNIGYYKDGIQKDCVKCSNCKGNMCNNITGECFGCQDERFYGPMCNISCSPFCKDQKCTQNGTCYSCIDNFYGDSCESQCDSTCINGCFRKGGNCYSCNHTTYGDRCQYSCEGCGDLGCNRQGYCNSMKCREGYYGLTCNQECECSSSTCGRNSGYCTDCKFGTFGKTNCEQDCYYLCQTQICCMLGSEDDMPYCSLISEEGKYVKVKIKEIEFKLGVDLNNSYSITLFTNSTKFNENTCGIIDSTFSNLSFDSGEKEIGKENITLQSMKVERTIYENIDVFFENFKCAINGSVYQNIQMRVATADVVDCQNKFDNFDKLDGFIGLGIFNQLTEDLLEKEYIKINFNSYYLLDKNLEITFGQIKQTNNRREKLDKYAICPLKTEVDSTSTGKNMTCDVSGIKFSNIDKEGFDLGPSNVQVYLNLERNSEIKLEKKYLTPFLKNYFKEHYENSYYTEYNNSTKTTIVKLNQSSSYINFPTIQIILTSSHTFTLNQTFLFRNQYRQFLIEFVDEKPEKNKNKSEATFILGKDFLTDKEFALNNEEGQLLIYCDERGYFTGDLVQDLNKTLDINISINDRAFALIITGLILAINIFAFLIYVILRKRKKSIYSYSEMNN